MMNQDFPTAEPLDAHGAWLIVRELGRLARAGSPLLERTWFRVERGAGAVQVPREHGALWVDPQADTGFGGQLALLPEVSALLRLYLPLCLGARSRELVIAHLGQSLDGQIATSTGASRNVTSDENLTHVHRLRALCDAVLVGASTVERDDPQLTTRKVSGDNPARVVIDPLLRTLSARLWRDRAARTLVVCESGRAQRARLPDEVEVVEVPRAGGQLGPAQIVMELQKRGLSRLLVEGGGLTVSRFLQARVAQRLHLCVSPLLLGSGRPGLALPSIERLDQALRPKTRRFELGEDVLFDCEFEVASAG